MGQMETEEQLLKRKTAGFPKFHAERIPVLREFAEDIDLPNPTGIVDSPYAYVAGIEGFMRDQVVEDDDWVWILTRIGYFIGEVLAKQLGGRWFVNDTYGMPTFARYVVGEFSGIANRNALIDPFEVAIDYLRTPPPRDLRSLMDETIEYLKRFPVVTEDHDSPRVTVAFHNTEIVGDIPRCLQPTPPWERVVVEAARDRDGLGDLRGRCEANGHRDQALSFSVEARAELADVVDAVWDRFVRVGLPWKRALLVVNSDKTGRATFDY